MNHEVFMRIVRGRRSIRKFKSTAIPKEKIDLILEAGSWAPSFANSQPWRFIVVDSPGIKEKLSSATAHEGIREAPVTIIVTVDPEKDRLHYTIDGANATMNMILMAYSLDLGTFWIGVSGLKIEDRVKEILGIPNGIRVVSIVPVGEAAESPSSTRKNVKELVFANAYGWSE